MKYLLPLSTKLFVLSFMLLLSSCAHPPLDSPPTADTPTQEPIAQEPGLERKPVTLVVGGAGVSALAVGGALKKLEESRIPIQRIIVTGWASLPALAFGLSESVHDMEWKILKLTKEDVFDQGFFNFGSKLGTTKTLSKWSHRNIAKKSLSQSSIPLTMSFSSLKTGQTQYVSKGLWSNILLRSMSVPLLHLPFESSGQSYIASLGGLDVAEARKLEPQSKIVVLSAYKDYFRKFWPRRIENENQSLRALWLGGLQSQIERALQEADISIEIETGRDPDDFSQSRRAFMEGYQKMSQAMAQILSED